MADELKQFSNHTGKTLSELTTGVTLASTTGSQKAVIKSVSIENEKARKIDIRLGSTTGTKIADGSKTGTLGGNEILDNSQSLVAHTSSELLFNDMIVAGWGERQYDDNGNGNPRTRTSNDGYALKLDHGAPNAVFTPDEQNIPWSRSNRSSVAWPDSADDGYSGKDWGESFQDKFGHIWVYNTAEDKDFEICGQNKGDKILYKLHGSSSTDADQSIKQFGGCRLAVYDGERYIYVFDQSINYIKKYDTHANPTTDTFTQVALYDCNTSDTTAMTVNMNERTGTGYYRDGYIVWRGEYGTGAGARFNITEVATGKTKALYDTKNNGSDNDGKGTNGNTRRTLGLVKDSAGDYWAWIANWSDTGNQSGYNYWHCTNMGSDPKTTYIPNSEGSTASASAKKTYKIDMWDACGNGSYGGAQNYFQMTYRLADRYGTKYDAPRGATVHTPGIDRYQWVFGKTYFQNSDATMSSNLNGYKLDFDNISDNQGPGGFWSRENWNFYDGSIQVRKDPNSASTEFGTVSVRTTGILVT